MREIAVTQAARNCEGSRRFACFAAAGEVKICDKAPMFDSVAMSEKYGCLFVFRFRVHLRVLADGFDAWSESIHDLPKSFFDREEWVFEFPESIRELPISLLGQPIPIMG